MRSVTLLRGARQLLTLRGPSGPRRGPDLRNLGLIQDGAVLVVDGLIHEVGPSRRLENLALAREAAEIDASGCVVMPGFVDSHTHLVTGQASAFAHSIQELSVRALEALAMRTLEQAVRHGATAIETRSGFGLTEAGETKILRVHSALQKKSVSLISTYHCAGTAPGYEDRPDEYVELLCSHTLPLVKKRKLAEFAGIRCGEDGFTVEQTRRYLTAARQLGFELQLDTGLRASPGVIRLAVELGAASIDHAPDQTEDDIALLARSECIVTLLPGRAFYQGSQCYPPARHLVNNGVGIALATGYNPETSPSESMPMAIALACRAMNLTPAEAITASTINAAHAVHRASSIGSLETGKSADLLILSVSDYREISCHFGVNLVDLVMKSGRVLVERSEVQWQTN
jgi:imidazolonepropionase